MALFHCQFYSQVLALNCGMTVILPDLPATPAVHARQPYPTLYLLHGLSDDHTIWQRRTSIERYVADTNLAVVMPAVQRSFYANMANGPRYWQFISEELPALARGYFPLSSAREENFVAGLSMGGYGAFKLALSYPQRFAAAASLSGALDVAERASLVGEASNEPEWQTIFGDPDTVRGSENDLFELAKRVADSNEEAPRLFQWCGTEDFLYADNQRFARHARQLGLKIDYSEGPGGHEWACWDVQIQQVLRWLKTN